MATYVPNTNGSLQMLSCKGFSLIELLIALAIVSLLAFLSVPVYKGYQVRGQRLLAQAELLEVANTLEAGYSNINGYKQISAYSFPDSNPTYRILMRKPNNNSYELTATPIGNQVGDGLLYLDSLGQRRHYKSDNQTNAYVPW